MSKSRVLSGQGGKGLREIFQDIRMVGILLVLKSGETNFTYLFFVKKTTTRTLLIQSFESIMAMYPQNEAS